MTTEQDYFDLAALGRSSLKDIYNEPKLYDMRQRGVARPRRQTESMAFGSALDAWLCDGKGADPLDKYFVLPFDSMRTKASKEARQAAIDGGFDPDLVVTEAQAARLTAESEQQVKRLEACAKSIADNPVANPLLLGYQDQGPLTQEVLTWTDEESGVAVKSMPDRIIPGVMIPDLKCSVETSEHHFLKQSRSFWYHVQAYMMQEGWRQKTGELLPVSFVVVRSIEPFNTEVYQASEQFIEYGRLMFRAAIKRYIQCRDSGVWESPTNGEIVLADPPRSWSYDLPKDV